MSFIQYETKVKWDPAMADVNFADADDRALAGLAHNAIKTTAGAPAATANQWLRAAIVQNSADSTLWYNSGTTASPVWSQITGGGGGGGVTSFNTKTGAIVVAAGTDISVVESPANTFTINYTGGATASPLTTKGDLYTYSTLDARLPVGTNGQILSANSAMATGLEWIAAPTAGQATIQFEDEGINLGTSGTATEVDFVGAGVTATRVLDKVTVTIPGGAAGLSAYGFFYQTVADVAGTIAADNGKALFQTAGANNTGGDFTMIAGSGDITVNTSGVYEVTWSVTCAEAGAMSLYIGAVKQTGTCFGTGAGTQNITGSAILSLTAADVVSLRSDNCPAALTLQLSGTTNTGEVVTSIMLKKLN